MTCRRSSEDEAEGDEEGLLLLLERLCRHLELRQLGDHPNAVVFGRRDAILPLGRERLELTSVGSLAALERFVADRQ